MTSRWLYASSMYMIPLVLAVMLTMLAAGTGWWYCGMDASVRTSYWKTSPIAVSHIQLVIVIVIS